MGLSRLIGSFQGEEYTVGNKYYIIVNYHPLISSIIIMKPTPSDCIKAKDANLESGSR